MKKKVLVLGATGMLGSMVYGYLDKYSRHKIAGTARNNIFPQSFEVFDFFEGEKRYDFLKDFDYIINCIGIIKPFCKDDDPKGVFNAISINTLFPRRLSEFLRNSKTKVVQIATDCVYSGRVGQYNEDSVHDALDVYGKTKSLGEVNRDNLLNIRCSLVGPDKHKKVSLLEWSLNQKDGAKLKGYAHHKWNGVTTLQFAKVCQRIIDNNLFDRLRKTSHIHHYLPNKTVNKYELLKIFAGVFDRNYSIEEVDDVGEPVDRTLSTKFSSLKPVDKNDMKEAVRELKNYSAENRPL